MVSCEPLKNCLCDTIWYLLVKVNEMGNANGHVSDRRKSLSGGGAPHLPSNVATNIDINPHSAHNANVGSPVTNSYGTVSNFLVFEALPRPGKNYKN